MRFIANLLILTCTLVPFLSFAVPSHASGIVDYPSYPKKLDETLVAFAKVGCRPEDPVESEDPALTDEEIEGVINCFKYADPDQTKRYEVLARGEYAKFSGLSMACTRAVGIKCTKNFMRATFYINRKYYRPQKVTTFKGPGEYEASILRSEETHMFFINPYVAKISASGNSLIFYILGSTQCFHTEYNGCRNITDDK